MNDSLRDSGALSIPAGWAPAIYFVLGQLGWFGCVIGAARGAAGFGVALAAVLVVAHLSSVARPIEELKLVAGVVAIGAVWESALMAFGVVAYPHGTSIPGLAPLWILALWGLFAAQFNTTYRWLKSLIKTAALLGAVAGPVSFHAGAVLGALRFPEPRVATALLAAGWGCLLPVVVLLSRRWDGVRKA